jgi:hypothetical protein
MSQGKKNIAIVSACGQGRTVGTPKAKLIICDEVSPFTEDQVQYINERVSRTVAPTGIIAEGVVPSAGAVIVMAGETIPISPYTVMANMHLDTEVPFPIAEMRKRPFGGSGSFQMTIDPDTIAKGSFMAMLCGYIVPNHIIQSLRRIQESLGVESESILKLAADMAKFENGTTLDMLKKLNSSWFDPIPYDFGTMAEMFSRRNRRKKKLRPDQGKKRKRQIEKTKGGKNL